MFLLQHLKNIFQSGELDENSVYSILEYTAADGKVYSTKFYNLDFVRTIPEGLNVNNRRWSVYPRGTGGQRPLSMQPQRGWTSKPRVARIRATLGVPPPQLSTPTGLHSPLWKRGAVSLGLACQDFRYATHAAACTSKSNLHFLHIAFVACANFAPTTSCIFSILENMGHKGKMFYFPTVANFETVQFATVQMEGDKISVVAKFATTQKVEMGKTHFILKCKKETLFSGK